MNKIILYALLGAVIGLVLAELFPSLGKGDLGRGVNDLAISLGKQKPYAVYAAIGAVVGAILAAVTPGKE